MTRRKRQKASNHAPLNWLLFQFQFLKQTFGRRYFLKHLENVFWRKTHVKFHKSFECKWLFFTDVMFPMYRIILIIKDDMIWNVPKSSLRLVDMKTVAFFAGSHYGGFELKLSPNSFMAISFCATEGSFKNNKKGEWKVKTKQTTKYFKKKKISFIHIWKELRIADLEQFFCRHLGLGRPIVWPPYLSVHIE